MKILHYALGFPPYRSGGLTKLCVDLMVQQAKEGHTVAMLWPGQMGFVNQKVTIKNHENVKLSGEDILSLEVINPLPVSFDEGIADIAAFKNATIPLRFWMHRRGLFCAGPFRKGKTMVYCVEENLNLEEQR